MAAEQISRLRQGTANSSVNQYSRGAKRPKEQYESMLVKEFIVKQGYGRYAKKAANPGPAHLGKTYPRRTLTVTEHFFQVVVHGVSLYRVRQ